MTERLRSINIGGGSSGGGSGGGVGGSSTSSGGGNSGYTIIGAPTLISSTFTGATATPGLTAIGSNAGGSVVGLIGGGGIGTLGGYHLNAPSTNGGGTSNSNNNNSGSDTEPDLLPVMAQLNFHLMQDLGNASSSSAVDCNSIMNTSQISTASNDSIAMGVQRHPSAASSTGKHLGAKKPSTSTSCRFPKLEECAHFHYERVQLGPLSVRLVDDKSEILNSSIASQSLGGDVQASQNYSLRSFSPSICWFIVKVIPNRSDPFLVKRSFDNMKLLDEMLHRCVYDRKISGLKDLSEMDFKSEEDVEYAVAVYLERFSKIASDSLTCGTILTWLQLDNKGRRLPLADTDTMKCINTPAVGAAYGVRRYTAQASDEISIEVGDMISVIDMPSPAESIWWRGKKSHLQKSHYEVGFFPQSCVATIGDKVPRHLPLPAPLVGQLDVSPTKPVLRKHGKLIAFFRSFILSRPSRRRLKQSGIYRERVFSCDLSEHLLNSGQEIPMVLKCCAEFIEENGIVDGIYRLSGITSNIQKLRRSFDEEQIPDFSNPEIRQDIHAVSSLLKMYFRELPNPLCTYQLYDNFVEAIQAKSESNERLKLMKETVLKLPPPHYRTLKYLATHLNKISQHSARTGMTDKNLAIVWAPNLLRSPALESGGVAALRGVGVQAVVTEYLIRNCHLIFDPSDEDFRLSYAGNPASAAAEQRMDSLTDCESLLVEQREHDQSLCFIERPKSLSASGPKLISLEEAQTRHYRLDSCEMNKSMPINVISNSANIGSYIEVGGGPSSLPDKYHTVLPVPRSWQKRKTHSWKSIFTRNPRNSSSNNDVKGLNTSATTPAHKANTTAQVTFADEQAGGEGGLHMKSTKQDKPKSIDLFEVGKPMDICVRTSSVDSLRTTGHSRSVSHDSYFDLLQSPQRGVTTCPSRELSELGLNFDREEPEMRIFSDSESLVASPKVGKENIPPSRRVLRARPEEFSSTTNSVNPSPKKQPRLNLLSPSSAAAPQSWGPNAPTAQTPCSSGGSGDHNDESCCKRYKLEDQLSDIQFIDCSTPEHTISNPNTMYTSVQVHSPPKPSVSKTSLDSEGGSKTNNTTFGSIFENKEKNGGESSHIITRYSYPTVQVGAKRKDDTALKERFSYPGSGNSGKYVCRLVSKDVKMNVQDEQKKSAAVAQQQQHSTTNDELQTQRVTFSQQQQQYQKHNPPKTNKLLPDLLKPKNRYSYCDPLQDSNNSINFLLRSNSADINKDKLSTGSSNEMERSKISVTPSSPIQSPRYSLLVGETSSENSSAVTTPIYELDPIAMMAASQTSSQYDETKGFAGCCRASVDSICSNLTSHTEKRDMNALKRELSLDLDPANVCSKMSVDLTDSTRQPQSLHLMPSPNTHTEDNTSQSVTPSEFGYQHLNRQSNLVSLESSPNFDEYDNMERSFLSYDKSAITPSNSTAPLMGQSPTNSAKKLLPLSPIKATINITYNLKSPRDGPMLPEPETPRKSLLETSFDENIVYEQVKFFRNSVTEVNQLLSNGNPLYDIEKEPLHEEGTDEDQTPSPIREVNSNLIVLSDEEEDNQEFPNLSDDIQMSDNIDSLECDPSLSLYENVELRKPPTVYENMEGGSMKSGTGLEKLHLDRDRSSNSSDPRRSPSNFSVKQLATKFEVSPVEQQQAFDFNVRVAKKSDIPPTKNCPPQPPVKPSHNSSSKQQLNKTNQITRSLDENAFVREFGPKRLEDIARSVHQMDKIEEATRRKSFDFTRPKFLNPPKRLPGLPINEEVCQKNSLKLDLNNDVESPSPTSETEVKITPTTENRISLIQNNVAAEDPNNPGSLTTPLKVLSGVKLDRERIDRIKEERRHQLKEKYRADSFKSKSKTELREFQKDEDKFTSESLRVKSKSRGDVRTTFFQKDLDDNLKDANFQTSVSGGGGVGSCTGRVRSISDEKNQNNCDPENLVNIDKNGAAADSTEFSARATVQKFERKSLDYARERDATSLTPAAGSIAVDGNLRSGSATTNAPAAMLVKNSISSTRDKISPKFSIRDVTAMFESRSQNQQ
ncbi:GTPase-activating protein CdGAPr [Eupeodes corollae]|uniref:GTPase-activating protein CdGAPr n=1 Tax=Eupeodes corollae TaxID=290404 RepID=UPI002491D0C3|nr:GTPase-activating protein CdGAPr [Eupeodes corollae]XP_055906313.1 GTPase-activating protein CdGAPr [Eupeodes corollae]XP_055906314.1 GTPase-activating protein CdGAPr [Eupeodes corollae]